MKQEELQYAIKDKYRRLFYAIYFPLDGDKRLQKALNTLTDREKDIIEARFGLITGVPQRLEDVGRERGVTRERIRQIEAKAIRKLRHISRKKIVFIDSDNGYVQRIQPGKSITRRDWHIDQLLYYLPTRTIHALQNNGIETIPQLLICSYKDLVNMRNIGKISATRIQQKLIDLGYPKIN